jgi:membrane protease YdiL (CAAX protease family)
VKSRIVAAIEGLLAVVAAFALSFALGGTGLAVWGAVEQRPVQGLLSNLLAGGAATAVDPSEWVAVLIIVFSSQSLVLTAVGLALGRRRATGAAMPSRWSLPRSLALGAAGGVAAVVGTIAISGALAWLGIEVEEQPWVVALVQADPRALWVLLPWIVVIGPAAEEAFFRFYLFRFFHARIGPGFGYLASALTFAVLHFHPPALPLYVFYGLLLAWIYRTTSRLSAPIFTHVLINLVSVVALTLEGGQAG